MRDLANTTAAPPEPARTPVSPTLMLRSKRPLAAAAVRMYVPFAIIAAALIFAPQGPIFWGLIAAALLVFALFPVVITGLLAPLEREVLAATPKTAPGLLEALRGQRRVRSFAPYAWTALQEGRLQLVRGEGRAAARALTESLRLAGVSGEAPAPVVSAQAHALLLADTPEQARELLQSLVRRQAAGPWDQLHLAVAQLLAGRARPEEARALVDAAQAALGATPRVLATRALVEQRAGESEPALAALRGAEAGLSDETDPLTQQLVERARRLLRPAAKASENRARKLAARAEKGAKAGAKDMAQGPGKKGKGGKDEATKAPGDAGAATAAAGVSPGTGVKGQVEVAPGTGVKGQVEVAPGTGAKGQVAAEPVKVAPGVMLALPVGTSAAPAAEAAKAGKTREEAKPIGNRNIRREERRAARRAAKLERRATQRNAAVPARPTPSGGKGPAKAAEAAPAKGPAKAVEAAPARAVEAKGPVKVTAEMSERTELAADDATLVMRRAALMSAPAITSTSGVLSALEGEASVTEKASSVANALEELSRDATNVGSAAGDSAGTVVARHPALMAGVASAVTKANVDGVSREIAARPGTEVEAPDAADTLVLRRPDTSGERPGEETVVARRPPVMTNVVSVEKAAVTPATSEETVVARRPPVAAKPGPAERPAVTANIGSAERPTANVASVERPPVNVGSTPNESTPEPRSETVIARHPMLMGNPGAPAPNRPAGSPAPPSAALFKHLTPPSSSAARTEGPAAPAMPTRPVGQPPGPLPTTGKPASAGAPLIKPPVTLGPALSSNKAPPVMPVPSPMIKPPVSGPVPAPTTSGPLLAPTTIKPGTAVPPVVTPTPVAAPSWSSPGSVTPVVAPTPVAAPSLSSPGSVTRPVAPPVPVIATPSLAAPAPVGVPVIAAPPVPVIAAPPVSAPIAAPSMPAAPAPGLAPAATSASADDAEWDSLLDALEDAPGPKPV